MAKNCCTSSSSSAGRLRQEPSITKNCCTSSSIREEFLRIAKSSASNARGCNVATFSWSCFDQR